MPLSASARARIETRIVHLERVRDEVVVDADTHPSDPESYPPDLAARLSADPDYFHGRPIDGAELLGLMGLADVGMALCWQNPAVTHYTDDPAENARRLLAANAAIAGLAERHPDRIIPAGWTDPKALGLDAARSLARAVRPRSSACRWSR